MKSIDIKLERKKVPLDLETYNVLKTFSRYHGLKLRHVVAAMADTLLTQDELSAKIIELAKLKSTDHSEQLK